MDLLHQHVFPRSPQVTYNLNTVPGVKCLGHRRGRRVRTYRVVGTDRPGRVGGRKPRFEGPLRRRATTRQAGVSTKTYQETTPHGVSIRTSEHGYYSAGFLGRVMSLMSHFLRYELAGPGTWAREDLSYSYWRVVSPFLRSIALEPDDEIGPVGSVYP